MQEKFNFQKLVKKYHQRIAVVDGGRQYCFDEVYKRAKKISIEAHFAKPYVVLNAQNNMDFICKFLAVHLAECVPIVLTSQQSSEIAQLLDSIRGQWQWFTSQDTDLTINMIHTSDILFLGATSGTTGVAKIYQRNWQSWRLGFNCCRDVFDMNQYDGVMTTSAMNTSLGLHTLMLSLYMGKTFYCFNRHVSQRVDKDTIVFSVPTYLTTPYNHWSKQIGIKAVVSCGGILDNHLIKAWQMAHPKQQLYELYGSSETSLISWQKINQIKKQNNIGQLFPDVSISLTADQCIVVNSPYLFSGYLGHNPDVKLQVETDDVGYYDGEHLHLLSRKSDVINHGGNKIYPSEIEESLRSVTQDVIVFGVPDEIYGENIVAMVVTEQTEMMLKSHVAGCLPKYKWPVQYIFVNDIPVTAQQKKSRSKIVSDFIQGRWV